MTDKFLTFDTLIVVADKFAEFTSGKPAVTLSQLRAMLVLPEHMVSGPVQLLPGQGLSDLEIADLLKQIAALDPTGSRWDLTLFQNLSDRADAEFSHKRKSCNTLIGSPTKVAKDTYFLDLRIDQECELMGDHQTGQHVQGMLLVEAARQSFLAVTEKYLLTSMAEKTYFVITSITTEFKGFVFPLPAHIEYRVLSSNVNERRHKYQVEMDFVQGGESRTRVGCAFTVYPHQVITQKEATLALDAAKCALASTSAKVPARAA
ncbi:AfsA-related hotdog domain-containing protein [Ruegeria sp. EL01]|jgi:hypothetical protein|uniref:AfsA-related hotdog domain-containing protein n=1 Tax=Ruegeria sp. EL01 TaxID=2107578 RepID=UPI000EA7F43C|nr:AfsA-related hotdog domain-containing protein [Ruegeria sp. EL01]